MMHSFLSGAQCEERNLAARFTLLTRHPANVPLAVQPNQVRVPPHTSLITDAYYNRLPTFPTNKIPTAVAALQRFTYKHTQRQLHAGIHKKYT